MFWVGAVRLYSKKKKPDKYLISMMYDDLVNGLSA